jgi:hypothetical protein
MSTESLLDDGCSPPVSWGAFVEVARVPGCALGLQLLLFATLAQPKSLTRTNFKAPKTRPPTNANFLRFFSARLVAAPVRSLRRCPHLPRLSHPPPLLFLAASFTADGADVGAGRGFLHPQQWCAVKLFRSWTDIQFCYIYNATC